MGSFLLYGVGNSFWALGWDLKHERQVGAVCEGNLATIQARLQTQILCCRDLELRNLFLREDIPDVFVLRVIMIVIDLVLVRHKSSMSPAYDFKCTSQNYRQ